MRKEDIAIFIRAKLKDNNMTQRELAERCDITESAVSYYLCGKRYPRSDTLCKIVKALGCDLIISGGYNG